VCRIRGWGGDKAVEFGLVVPYFTWSRTRVIQTATCTYVEWTFPDEHSSQEFGW
jgi:hypothetical protein